MNEYVESLSHYMLHMEPNRVTKLIHREVRRVTLTFVRITFRDGDPQKTSGGCGLGLPPLDQNHVLNSWKTNTIR